MNDLGEHASREPQGGAALSWTRDAHGWIAPCGSEGQGEARCLPFRNGWAWMLDMLPGTDEPTLVAQDVFARLDDAKAEAERQVEAWPIPIAGAKRV